MARRSKAWPGQAWRRAAGRGNARIPLFILLAGRGAARCGKAGHGAAWRGKARNSFSMVLMDTWQGDLPVAKEMFRINVTVVGVTPLIMNKFTDANAQRSTDGSGSSASAADRGTPQEIADSKVYLDLNGKPAIPQPNLLRSIVDGGSYHKIGKSQVTTKERSLIFACCDIESAMIPLIHKQPYRVFTVPIVIPATKGRILSHRPMFDDWQLSFSIILDGGIINHKLLRNIIDDAGARCGLGDFRPARKGPYGRYSVNRWDVKALKPPVNVKAAA